MAKTLKQAQADTEELARTFLKIKVCRICGKEKPKYFYYSGHNECKACTLLAMRGN